jgi:hypothetical protein
MGSNPSAQSPTAASREQVAQVVQQLFHWKESQSGRRSGFLSQFLTDIGSQLIAVRDVKRPIGVAQWQTQLGQSLSEPLRSNLPIIEQIEEELRGETQDRVSEGKR